MYLPDIKCIDIQHASNLDFQYYTWVDYKKGNKMKVLIFFSSTGVALKYYITFGRYPDHVILQNLDIVPNLTRLIQTRDIDRNVRMISDHGFRINQGNNNIVIERSGGDDIDNSTRRSAIRIPSEQGFSGIFNVFPKLKFWHIVSCEYFGFWFGMGVYLYNKYGGRYYPN